MKKIFFSLLLMVSTLFSDNLPTIVSIEWLKQNLNNPDLPK